MFRDYLSISIINQWPISTQLLTVTLMMLYWAVRCYGMARTLQVFVAIPHKIVSPKVILSLLPNPPIMLGPRKGDQEYYYYRVHSHYFLSSGFHIRQHIYMIHLHATLRWKRNLGFLHY